MKEVPLDEDEIIWELSNSREYLEDITGIRIREFVYPYGLYNSQILTLIRSQGIYERATTCEVGLSYETEREPLRLPRVIYTKYLFSSRIHRVSPFWDRRRDSQTICILVGSRCRKHQGVYRKC